MKIWFHTPLFIHNPISDDCDICPKDGTDPPGGGCPTDRREYPENHYFYPNTSSAPIAFLFTEDIICTLHAHSFTLSKTLYTQQCCNLHWVICNPIGAGRVAVIDEEMYTFFRGFDLPKTPQEVAEDIDNLHMSSSDIVKVIALFLYLGFLEDLNSPAYNVHQGSPQTLGVWLHVTNACNLRCHYCYVQKTADAMADDTSKRAIDAVIRSAVKYCYTGIYLTYAGGEATLRLPQVFVTHDYALQQTQKHGLSLSASLLSNGVALPSRLIDQLKQYQLGLMISLDGVGEDHDKQRPLVNGKSSFTLVDRTITRLLAKQLVPYINVTVTQRNLDALPKLIEYVLQRDLPFGLSYYRENECSTHLTDLQFTDAQMIRGMHAAFSYIEQHLPKRSLLNSLIDKASMSMSRQYTCGVGRNYMVIDQRGGVAKCQVDIGQTITTIDAEDPLQAIREYRQGVQAVAIEDKEGCRTCEWRFWCTGGCPMLTYHLTGRSDIRSPNCAIYKALFPDALRLEALRLLKYESPIEF